MSPLGIILVVLLILLLLGYLRRGWFFRQGDEKPPPVEMGGGFFAPGRRGRSARQPSRAGSWSPARHGGPRATIRECYVRALAAEMR